VERTALGNAVVDELYVMCKHYPAIRIFQFCLMPDHLHAVIRVTKVMDTSIRSVIRGYWQGDDFKPLAL
jgi:REP element-mobilizing transposase RayT